MIIIRRLADCNMLLCDKSCKDERTTTTSGKR